MNRSSIRVLLIEDNPGDARLIQEMLAEGKGWIGALECVESLAAGLLRIERGDIDVVLLDLGLPDSAGLDTLRRLRAGAPQAPVVVVMSGISDEEVGMQAVQEGAQDYLVKGQVSSGLLIRSIRYAIERNEAEKALLQARDELESQVRGRTARLTQAIKSLEKENAERKRAEEALRESRLRLDNIVANSPGAIYRCANDLEWTMEFLSAAITRITGYPADDFLNNRVRSFASIIHPDDRRRVAEAVAAGLERKDRYDMDYRLMAADGTLRWVHEQGQGVFAPDGRLLCLDGVIFDITAQRLAEESLRESEQRYRMVFENSPVSIWEEDFFGVKSLFDNLKKEGVTDIETYFAERPETVRQCADLIKIVDVNQAALALHAAANKNELMANLANTFTPESFDTFLQELICLWNGGTEMMRDAVVKTLAGDVRNVTVSFSVCPGYEDTLSKVLVSLTDITERKQAEEALLEKQNLLLEAQQIAHIGNWWHDMITNEVYWSDEFFRIIGREPQKPTLELGVAMIHPDDWQILQHAMEESAAGKMEHEHEFRIVRPDGEIRWIHNRWIRVNDKNGKEIKRVGTYQDITERKRAEAISGARLHLMQFASTHSLDDFLEETLNEAEKLTQSTISFYVFVEDDQVSLTLQNWSARTKAEFCKAEGKGLHYNISEAGVWVDCIIQGKPVIHNDYASLPHRKGMPEGHAELIRELVVPVLRGDKIKAVVAVGNKQSNYNETDVEALSLLADVSWEIAERKRAEEKILRSDQRLRLHSEQSPLGFLEWDDNFHAIEWNAACERIFGYTREEAIGRHAKDLILPVEVHELVDEIYHSLMNQTGGQHSINENITKDGRIITCEWFNTTLIDKDGKAIGVASVCRDITEQKRMEVELARYREHLEEQVKERTAELEIARNKAQQYLDIAGVILVAINKNRRVTLINQKGCDILGNTSREIVGKDWFETFVPENARQDVIQCFQQLMEGELEPVEYFENPVLTQGDEERLVAWHNVLLKDSEGNITGTLSSGEDITEKKRAEEQIIRLNQDLRHRAAALEAANKELEAFAYSVSHDLRAPLRHIDGFIELLKKKAGTNLDEQNWHYMDTISDAAQKMGRLIDELLSFSRMGRQAMSFQQVDLGPLVRDVIRELEPDAAGRNIEWRIGDLPAVGGDASMLRMVLVNLISNALKFTRPVQQAEIEIGSMPDTKTETIIFVRDNGIGFDMNYVGKLFNVFQRLHRVDEFEGTGIGLANVRRIIQRHSGRTWAEGKVNQGATFYFLLPHSTQEI